MKKAISNYVVEAVKSVKNIMNHLTAQNSDAEVVVENAEVQPGQKRKRDDELSLASVEQKDEQGPCLELVQVGHPSTSSGRGMVVASNVGIFSCEELEILQMKMDHLSGQKSDVETFIEHAEIQPGKKRKKEVELWLNRVEQMKTELENIEAELEEQGSCKKLKNYIVSITGEVEELTRQRNRLGELVLDDHPSTRLAMIETSLVSSRSTENIEMILNWLKEEGVSAIGVHGMGGVGKTTLLKTIHNKLLQDYGINGQVYWVTASHDCSLQKLQAALGRCLGLGNIEEEDDERRKSLIYYRLCQLPNSVLIIDDLWAHYPTDKIGIPLESCKIVITTRSLDVCQKVGCEISIKVAPLWEEDAWSLFVEKSGIVANNFVPIARGIVAECAGLPLALITMGSCMRGVTDVHQWENTLLELQKPARRQDNDMDDKVFRILQFSYDSLKEERMKQCFLSCVFFPEDFNIPRDELIELWITEGLLDGIEGWGNKVNKGHTILNRLENSSLLELTIVWEAKRCVRMHDLIRDMAMIVAQGCVPGMVKAGLRLNKVPEQKEWTIDLVKVSLSSNNIKEIPCGLSPETPNLKVLILSGNFLYEIPESFFVHMKALQVLDLSHTLIKRLPDTVSDLENLRGLFLKGCDCLSYVPFVAKLTKLMALDLDGVESLEEGVEGLGRLNCLEKLYYYSPWNILDVPGFNNLMLYGQLKVYNIVLGSTHDEIYFDDTITDHEIYFDDTITDHEKEVTIYRHGEIIPVLPSTIQSLIIKSSRIEAQRSLEEAFPSLRQATDLRKLELSDCEGLDYLFISASCPLRCLKLHNLDNLMRIAKVGLYPSFSKLKILEIVDCPKIRVVFPCTLRQQHGMILPNLESITIQSCDQLEEIIEFNERSSSSSQTTGHTINATFPILRFLRLRDLPKLGSVYSMRLHLCTSLEVTEIEDCPKIEEIFGDMNPENVNRSVALPRLRFLSLINLSKLGSLLPLQLHLCTCLKEIEIHFCPNLESISEQVQEIYEPDRKSSETVDHRVGVPLPNLRLVQLTSLPKLSCSIYSLQLHLCTSLEILSIKDCPKIEGVFTNPGHDTELILDLPSLKHFRLCGFPELMRSLYQIQLHLSSSSSSSSSMIEECRKIERAFTNATGGAALKPTLALPKLYSLHLKGLPNMSSICKGLVMCPEFGLDEDVVYPIKLKERPQLHLRSLSRRLIFDASPSEFEDPESWVSHA